jgi:hypothetical protein
MAAKIILSNQIDYNLTRDSIALQTSKKRDIENYQIRELSTYEINLLDIYPKKYPSLKFKGLATPIYNCHGFVFASRRTNISDSQAIRNILSDDEYISVSVAEVMVGDIVLYVDPQKGDIEHTAMIVQVEGDGVHSIRSIRVLSKWGKYKEVVHFINECEDFRHCRLEYWRNNHGYIREK